MDPLLFATAYTLSTSVGIRPFLTLALASLAMHLGYLHPAHEFAFLGSDGATVLLASFAMLEFIAEKVPAVDHLLHVVHIAAKPVAAAILVGSAAPDIVQGDGSSYTYALMGAAALNACATRLRRRPQTDPRPCRRRDSPRRRSPRQRFQPRLDRPFAEREDQQNNEVHERDQHQERKRAAVAGLLCDSPSDDELEDENRQENNEENEPNRGQRRDCGVAGI